MVTTQQNLNLVTAAELKEKLDQDQVLLIDVREPGEFSAERIPGARLIPLSKFDPKHIPATDKEVVLYCRSGKRSEMAAQKLLAAGWNSVTNLQGGITSWKQAGLPIDKDANAPISLIRQVQIVAGSLVLTGTLLGAYVNPRFLFLSGFVGAGLVFAGVTDTCALGMLLSKLPYNQRAGQSWNS
ncbi:MAG: rhodanese-like domain-containing protein [Pseudanabaenaceae cyanobacterium SKYGB_i_bin29]|nr:rhodanese-like domain-containing protein [Pseudanabaenaceae cyanobacterium SKYG29]MDW8420393.1 rhodanese-like domain-containing protein [Pseudanabaenaceae cyanobacterium SKYGB_i_bin29]